MTVLSNNLLHCMFKKLEHLSHVMARQEQNALLCLKLVNPLCELWDVCVCVCVYEVLEQE